MLALAETDLTQVAFGDVQRGNLFKETLGGAWYLKVSSVAGECRSHGSIQTPRFSFEEIVWVPRDQRLCTCSEARLG